MSTDATFYFNNKIKVATLSNAKGVCTGYDPRLEIFAQKGGVVGDYYVSGDFEPQTGTLQLEIPLKIDPAAVKGNGTDGKYSITFTPKKYEPCPNHGLWAKNLYWGAESQYRTGSAEISFDVRATMLAVALNLGRVSTGQLVEKRSTLSEALGLIGYVDPYYTFPPMARIYCVDKSSQMWNWAEFSQDEKDEQQKVLNSAPGPGVPPLKMMYPNICFVVNSIKGGIIQMFYPMISSLKSDRDDCWNYKPGDPKACKADIPSTNSPLLVGCECSDADRISVDCNRQSLYLGYFYDTNFPPSQTNSSSAISALTAPSRIKNDRAVKMGINVQKKIAAVVRANGKNVEDYDIAVIDSFEDVFSTTMSVFKNIDGQHLTYKIKANKGKCPGGRLSPSGTCSVAPSEANREAYQNLYTEYLYCPTCKGGTQNPNDAPVTGIIFRSVAYVGYGNVVLPINKFNLQLQDLIEHSYAVAGETDIPKYYERYADMYFPSVACKNPFNLDTALKKFIENPPIQLTENYYECVKNPITAFVVALGTAYSSTNLLANILWAIVGYFFIQSSKSYLKHAGSARTVVTNRTKKRLVELHEGMRDASLVETIKCLSDRLQKLEAKCSVSQTSEELKDEQLKVHKFHILHDLPHRNEADHEEIALGLAKLANQDAQDQDDETFHTIKLLLSAFNPSHPTQAHFHHSKSSYEDQRQIQVGHMLEDGEPQSRDHQPVQAATRRESQRGAQLQMPTAPQQYQEKEREAPAFDPHVIAANVRRLSVVQRSSIIAHHSTASPLVLAHSSGDDAPAAAAAAIARVASTLQMHPMSAVLSGMTPPSAQDISSSHRSHESKKL